MNLELRQQVCKALGWKFWDWCDRNGTDIRRLIDPHELLVKWAFLREGQTVVWLGGIHAAIDLRESLPAIESDPAISEPMFLEFCDKYGYCWDLSQCDSDVICEIWADAVLWRGAGSTPSEARARAILAAVSPVAILPKG